MDIINAILTRSSYRGKYMDTIVPRNDLKKIMEVGLAAPSGSNKQTTSLIAIDDVQILNKLHSVVNSSICETAHAMICVLTKRICSYRGKCYNIQDYSAAIENMLLACVELGDQSCWIEGIITDSDNIRRQMAKIVSVPDENELVCFLPVGVASEPLTNLSKKVGRKRAWFNEFNKDSKEGNL
ncbi:MULTISPECIES: nitroreductase family protein [Clostridium]|nr:MULTISPECIES: nitroreductase family protein [Clostridium]MDU4846398.1 nitroreductase family protein [Clostridium sp.]CAH0436365.1 Putative nitroreductase-like protein [Clostridium neonatale]CAI3243675.1 putative nitroreductase-like protein [Clostridium neonatale]CAI3244074.1 putative nitroreductase-like protein [Clostridium neonatale]CAI3539513.1 putative nitroreductase-like protein [Clostridium neonatale]